MPRIRSYRPEDWSSFVELDIETGLMSLHDPAAEEQEHFKARWPEVLRNKFAWSAAGPTTNNGTLLVLETDDGAYAGHLWLSEQEDLFSGQRKLWVTTVAVVAQYRGRGFGRLLVERALEEMKARGLGAIGLGVDARNEAARKLYSTMGFVTMRVSMERRRG